MPRNDNLERFLSVIINLYWEADKRVHFIVRVCILLRVLSVLLEENRLSQQLYKILYSFIIIATCFGLRMAVE
jgi:hypothetical protein